MAGHLLSDLAGIAVAAALGGAWVLVQSWIGRSDPGQPGVEGKCSTCSRRDGRSK